MAIRKEKNGTYSVDVSFGFRNGKRIRLRRKGIKKLKDAQEIEAKLRNDKEIKPKSEILTFRDAYSKYINFCKIEVEKNNMRNTTLESKISIFELHINPFFKNYILDEITKDDILLFQKQLLNKKNFRNSNQKLANETRRKIYKQLNAFFEYCFQEEYILVNVCHKVSNFKKNKKEKDFLTIEEFLTLTQNIDNIRDKTIINLLFFSGIRISELLGLNINSINLNDDKPYIKIMETCHKGVIRDYAKTESSQEIVYIDETTKSILIKYINSDEFLSYNSKYLFPSLKSNCHILSEKAVENMIKKYCELANIQKHITPHSLRHSHAAMLIAMGKELEDIKDRLRHASIKTTSDEYGHMYNSRKKELVDDISKYVNTHQN